MEFTFRLIGVYFKIFELQRIFSKTLEHQQKFATIKNRADVAQG